MDSDDDIYEMVSDEELSDDGDSKVDEKNYRVLKDTDIRHLMEEDVAETSSILSIPRDVCLALLRHFNWSVTRANEEWFANETKIRTAIGMLLLDNETHLNSHDHQNCGICFEEYSLDKIASAACKHPFCKECWESYIGTSISDGPKCLVLRCPQPSCSIMIGQSMINTLATEKDRLKYDYYLCKSYVEENRNIKWCPAPGCDYAVELDNLNSDNYYVICGCFNGFCWKCLEENHRPVDCDSLAKWKIRNDAEAENTNWILAFTKMCPKCGKSIEKNQGCMHMTCRCSHQFCWICLKDWSKCGYGCNRYNNKEQKEVKQARKSIIRYTHYYERWAANEKSKQKAIKDLNNMRNEGVKKLSELHSLLETELEFIIEAWQQIVECRRVLKWTYVYGFYLPEEEEGKLKFFEYLQGEAEAGLERLHHTVEKELLDHLGTDKELDYRPEQGNYKHFVDCKQKVITLTNITGTYFDKLVTALENELQVMDDSKDSKRKREAPADVGVEDSGLLPCDRGGARRVRRCGLCKETGHDRRNCPNPTPGQGNTSMPYS